MERKLRTTTDQSRVRGHFRCLGGGELRPVFIGDYKQKLSIEGFGSLSSESVSS